METFGSRLKFLRKRLALTQEELGKILNVSTSSIGMYERGEREPSFKILIHIADYFETSTDYLLGHETGKNNHSFLQLSKEEENLLVLKQEYPVLFEYIQKASPSEIKKITRVLKIIL